MDLLTIAQWLITIVSAFASIPGVIAFFDLRKMKRLKIEAIYESTGQEKTFPGKFFLMLKVTPGAKDTVIRSISVDDCGVHLCKDLDSFTPEDCSRASPMPEFFSDSITPMWLIPSRSSSDASLSAIILGKRSSSLMHSDVNVTILSEFSLCSRFIFIRRHRLKIRLAANNETIRNPHAETFI